MCTGIEPIFLGMGASAGTAAALATATGAVGAGLAAKQAAKALTPKMPDIKVPKPEAPPAESKSQAAKQPDRAAAVAANIAAAGPGGALSGNSATFLTGPSGVDPSTLNLGKNKLLGQ